MNTNILSFIEKFKNTERDICNFVCCYKPFGSYYFDTTKFDEFLTLYCDVLYQNSETLLHIAEIPKQFSMFVIDIDFKKEIKEDTKETLKEEIKHIYSDIHIKTFIKLCQDILKKTIIGYNDKKGSCVFLEKPAYKKGKYIKSGFHIVFPYIFVKKTDLDFYIYPFSKKERLKYLSLKT